MSEGPQPLEYEPKRVTVIAARARRGRFATIYLRVGLGLILASIVGAYVGLDLDSLKILWVGAVAFLVLWLFTHDRRKRKA